ncbi:MAG TPA: prepilin-type N-terminal cleavage/methylation domain-containing protein [Steroidobacteraceae bacterium]|jgi:type II secretion system protein H|nr:prepilin-type N-terminal cleavage/methylation domain-containing protein [Steroidobacteraceae bacterium]
MSRPGGRRQSARTCTCVAPHAARGFTLLELLVVMVIIGIVIAGAIISLGSTGRDRGLEQERDRLSALIDYVRDQGALMTTEYGILCGQHGYRFVYYDNLSMQWLPETLDDTLRERRLPSGLDLQLVIEGRPIVLDDAALQVSQAPGALAALSSATSAAAGSAPGPSGGSAASASSTAPGAAPAGFGSGIAGPSGDTSMPADAPPVQTNSPQILLLSNGDTNSFQLTIERPSSKRSVTFKSADDGTIKAGDILEPPK